MSIESLSFKKTLPQQEEEKKMEKEGIIPLEKLQEMALNKEQPRKKVLLVDGNITESQYQDDEYHLRLDNLGLRRIAGYLKKFGVDVNVIRLQNLAKEEGLSQLIDEAEVIGMSAQSTSVKDAFDFCRDIKRDHPEKTVIGGAEHFALDYDWILKNQDQTGIDACCVGQGELPMLALSLGILMEKVGSLAYEDKGLVYENSKKTMRNFPRLEEEASLEVLKPAPAASFENEVGEMPFLELDKHFENAGSTATSTGCIHKCTFCTSDSFYGDYVSCLETAKAEILQMYNQGKDFMFVRDALLNAYSSHLESFLKFMREENLAHEKKIGWVAFMSVKGDEGRRRFKEMADAGCVEIAVGVEDVIGDRRNVKKGAKLETATAFINEAKESVLVRTLLILGFANHYAYTREEMKDKMLSYMKSNPQALYRINILTPVVGTPDFKEYGFMNIEGQDPRQDISQFKKHDTMHGTIDPKKMYASLKVPVPEEKRWVKNPEDWEKLRDEIMKEYLESPEHQKFLETLKEKENLGRKGLLYEIAQDFKKLTLESVKK